jgi:hypothetical protein
MNEKQENPTSSKKVKYDMNGVLVVWSSASDESEASSWTQLIKSLTRTVRDFFTYSTETQTKTSTSEALDFIVQELLEEDDEETVRIHYCTDDWATVSETLKDAIDQGTQQILIMPIAFTADKSHSESASFSDLTAEISEFEYQHPQVEIIYVGPPFEPKEQFRLIFNKIHDDEPEKANLLQDVVARGFGGDWSLFTRFMQELQKALPPDTNIALRGSAVTGHSWTDNKPFDALGSGTSDLDIVLIGEQVMSEWAPNAFYIPQVNTMPLSDEMPDIAPSLNPVRVELQKMIGRPVNIQAMSKWFLELRYRLLGQLYLILD